MNPDESHGYHQNLAARGRRKQARTSRCATVSDKEGQKRTFCNRHKFVMAKGLLSQYSGGGKKPRPRNRIIQIRRRRCLWSELMDSKSHWCEGLYEEKAAQLVLYGRALGLSHGEAEDVLQETFLALMRQEQRPEKPLNYCLRSFRNRALNYRRSLWRRIAREFGARHWFEHTADESPRERAAM